MKQGVPEGALELCKAALRAIRTLDGPEPARRFRVHAVAGRCVSSHAVSMSCLCHLLNPLMMMAMAVAVMVTAHPCRPLDHDRNAELGCRVQLPHGVSRSAEHAGSADECEN